MNTPPIQLPQAPQSPRHGSHRAHGAGCGLPWPGGDAGAVLGLAFAAYGGADLLLNISNLRYCG
jgi:hypothetical protein